MTRSLAILGAGGYAGEVAELATQVDPPFTVVAFVDPSARSDAQVHEIPVVPSLETMEGHTVSAILGSGDIAPRRRQAAEIDATGLSRATLIHRAAVVSPSSVIGEGCVVAPNAVISTGARLGRDVLVNYGATVGHDCVVEDGCVVSPGANVSGWCHLESNVYVGAGAVLLPKVRIGANAVVGAGAVVTRDVAQGATVVGVPARETKG